MECKYLKLNNHIMKVQPTPEIELTTKEVADRTQRTPSRIRQLIDAKVIVGYRPNGSRDWWIPESQVAVINDRPEKRGRKKKAVE